MERFIRGHTGQTWERNHPQHLAAGLGRIQDEQTFLLSSDRTYLP